MKTTCRCGARQELALQRPHLLVLQLLPTLLLQLLPQQLQRLHLLLLQLQGGVEA